MTPKERLSIAWAQAQMLKAMQEGKSDVECMTILKEAYEDAMVLLGFFDLLRRGGIAPPQHLPIVSLQNQAIE